MAEEAKAKKNPMAEAANWNARCITEEEAPHKWNEAWGQLFDSGIPHDYAERIEFLEKELSSCPKLNHLPKYGVGEPFREALPNFRKKPFDMPTQYTTEELDEVIRNKKKALSE